MQGKYLPEECLNVMDSVTWASMARGIEQGQNDAVERFYHVFNDGFRHRILRALGPEGLEDSVHTCVVTLITAIRRGGLQEHDRLLGFANTIVKRHIAQQIESRIHERNGRTHVECLDSFAGNQPNAEVQAERAQARAIMLKLLSTMSCKDHEVLRRFYLLGQSEPQICADMRLSAKQFQNLKHRAKQRFVDRWNSAGEPTRPPVRESAAPRTRRVTHLRTAGTSA